MAEVQKTTLSGELSQRFIEFVMMHAQNAALFLGQIPNPTVASGPSKAAIPDTPGAETASGKESGGNR